MKKELALGMMRLPVTADKKIDYAKTDQLVDYFLEHGFRKFDTAELYHDTQSESAIRECIVKRHKRESFEIADKLQFYPQLQLPYSRQLQHQAVLLYFLFDLLHRLFCHISDIPFLSSYYKVKNRELLRSRDDLLQTGCITSSRAPCEACGIYFHNAG